MLGTAANLPEIFLKKAGDEFSAYLTDKHLDSRVARLQNEFITYNLDDKINVENSYYVIFKTTVATLAASFDAKGKLLSVVEQYKNAKLPKRFRYSLAQKLPGWSLITDKYSYVQRQGKNC